MFSKTFKTSLIVALMATAPSAPAHAGDLGAAIVGGVIGGVIVNEANKNRQRSQPRVSSGSAYSQRAANRETQVALNYFGFPAGTPDGVMGSRSRTAVYNYQSHMGYPATGQLTEYERNFLVSSYSRAQMGGPQVIKAMNSDPQGVRSLLVVWRDEAMGVQTRTTGYGGMPIEVSQAVDEIAASSDPSAEQLLQRSGFIQLADLNGDGKTDYVLDTSVTGSSFWCGASNCSVMVFASTPQGYARNDFLAYGATPAMFSCHQAVCRMNDTANDTVMASAQGQAPAAGFGGITALPMAVPEVQQASLASHCSKVSLLTNSNGGFVTLANLSDPEMALSEQFCLTRTYAIATGEDMVRKVQGLSQAQIEQQCDAFGPALAPFVVALDSSDSVAVRSQVQKFALQSNMSLEQLKSTATICLFTGYRRDKMDVALGSALLLVGVGQTPYAELVGHHLANGFGVARNDAGARDWYGVATDALDNGAEPVFAPGQPERVMLLKAAASTLGGGAMAPAGEMIPTPAGLPSFSLE